MKALLAILFITLVTFTSNTLRSSYPQKPATQATVLTQKVYNDSLKVESEEKRKKYYIEAIKTESLTNKIIAKYENLGTVNLKLVSENAKLDAEIKKLKKVNDFLRQNIDTVYISVHDTVFKKRRFLQLFKN